MIAREVELRVFLDDGTWSRWRATDVNVVDAADPCRGNQAVALVASQWDVAHGLADSRREVAS